MINFTLNILLNWTNDDGKIDRWCATLLQLCAIGDLDISTLSYQLVIMDYHSARAQDTRGRNSVDKKFCFGN